MKKEESGTPILYEKYKLEHEETPKKCEEVRQKKSLSKRMVNPVLTSILLGMAFLSIIGSITLIQPQMRDMLMILLGRHGI